MFTLQDKFSQFIRNLESANPDSLDQALTLCQSEPQLIYMLSDKSPKYVEIFSHLQFGLTQTKVALRYYRIVSYIFETLSQNYDTYFRSLDYLADTIIRRHMQSMLLLMKHRKGEEALKLMAQAANVSKTHCKDLFSLIDFSNHDFREQANTEAREQLIKLLVMFLKNDDISPSFLATKYSVSGIWKNLGKDQNDIAREFFEAMFIAVQKLNISTKKWVFNEMTLKTLSNYPLDHREAVNPHYSAFKLLKTVLTGENSINDEDKRRVYCRSYQSLDNVPKNYSILTFIRELDPWKVISHCELVVSIFKDSPDLIGSYLSNIERSIKPVVNLSVMSSLRFLGKIIELDWPSFLFEEKQFFEDGHSLDLLFESILPSVIRNDDIAAFLKHKSVVVRRSIILLLLKSVQKFLKLPDALKCSISYTKFRGRLSSIIPQTIISTFQFESLFPFAVKLLSEMNNVFPFFVSDNFSKEPPFIQNIKSFPPYIQLSILNLILLLPKPILKIPMLCSIILDNEYIKQIKHEALSILTKVIQNAEIMNGFENEIPILISEALNNNAISQLSELIILVKGTFFKFSTPNETSPLYNALKPSSPLYNFRSIIDTMRSIVSPDLNLDPVEIMKSLKWYSLESTITLLCASIENNVGDIDFTLDCIRIVVSCSPQRTIPYIFNHQIIPKIAFTGNYSFDKTLTQFIQLSTTCNDIIAQRFLNGVVNDEFIDIIAPYIPSVYRKKLIKKLIKSNHNIREVIIDKNANYDLSEMNDFWQWAFKGFQPFDLSIFWPKMVSMISDENILLDLLRTIWITKDKTLLPYIQIPESNNARLYVFATELIPGKFGNINISSSLPLCYYLKRNVEDPCYHFEKTHKKWTFEFLLQQIRKTPFYVEIKRLSKNKLNAVIEFYAKSPSESIAQTFNRLLMKYLIKHPETITAPIPTKSAFITELATKIIEPSQIVQYETEQLEGIINILFGANIEISLRLILFLATGVFSNSSFYALLESIRMTPSIFLFATGESAKVVIQILDSKQNVNLVGLCRNASYLAPFHNSQNNVEVDTPFFRFLLHFAYFLLSNETIPILTMIERGVLTILFQALSSKDEHTREIAYHSLSQLYDYNHKKKDWKFEHQIALILESVLNAVKEPNYKFSSLISQFLAEITPIIIKPSHPLFMNVIKFLASNQSLKCSTVPMFSELFGQSSIDYRVGRMWILKFLRNGIKEPSDINLLLKGKIIERLCSFFSSSLSDAYTRNLVLEIFEKSSKQAKLENIIFWVYSIMTEPFSLMHFNQLITLALTTKPQTEQERECCKQISRFAITQHKSHLDPDTAQRIHNLIRKS